MQAALLESEGRLVMADINAPVTSGWDQVLVQQEIELAASRKVDVEGVVSHILPLEGAQRGMELAHSKKDRAIKIILEF